MSNVGAVSAPLAPTCGEDATVEAEAMHADALVDCGVYVDGHRLLAV